MSRDAQKLRSLIRQHHGCLSKIGEALEMTRQGATRRLSAHNLLEEAATARALAGVTGGRSALPGGAVDPIGERAALLDALATSPNNVVAAKRLGLDYKQLYRRMRALGIKPAEVVSHRGKLQSAAAQA